MIIPAATYRIQFNHLFGFAQAREIVPYLGLLGVSHLYASPIFAAREKSLHGYDIVDPGRINPELGGLQELRGLVGALRERGLAWLQDIVPNHMAYDSANAMLMDIFENGRASAFAHFFDIDWDHPYENMKGRILTPLLGSFYAEALESGHITLSYDEQGMRIRYYHLSLPLKIGSYKTVLDRAIALMERRLSGTHPDLIRFLGVSTLFAAQAPAQGAGARSEQIRHAKVMLWNLYRDNETIRQCIDETIVAFNGVKGDAASFEALDALILEQFFRLSFWKVATEEINYRRFFTVNELISLRVEDPEVFATTHKLVFDLIEEGLIDALRVDHIDGLYDPAVYLKRLRERVADRYVVVEKILAPAETLPAEWPVQGTTGYDLMNYINGVLCDRDNAKALSRIYRSFTGITLPYDELLCDKKRIITSKHLAGNVDNLAHLIKRVSSKDRYGRDITLYGLKRALVEVMANFPVYRTYVNSGTMSKQDASYLQQAIDMAKRRLPGFYYELSFIEKFLLLEGAETVPDEDRRQWVGFLMGFQQYTAPLMAKGVEDTMFYIYNRLISLNEVGGAPEQCGVSLKDFHDFNGIRAATFPLALNATSTHDTKRGEDVRARISVLSELPHEWDERLKRWAKMNRKKKTKVNGLLAPDENDEYFFYQTIIGAFPFEEEQDFTERIKAYMIKSVREAKRHTAWIKPDTEYENACLSFVEKALCPGENNAFLNDLLPFQRRIAAYGIYNSLSQTLLKMTVPGIPDFYQGAELWDLNLVDPDNRRPVDFSRRMRLLTGLVEHAGRDLPGLITDLFATKTDGRIKLFLIHRILRCIGAQPELFQRGGYLPLVAQGAHAGNVIAFARQLGPQALVVVAPRFVTRLVAGDTPPLGTAVWQDTRVSMPAGDIAHWENICTGETVAAQPEHAVGDLLTVFPVAALIGR